MNFSARILLGLAILLAAGSAVGQVVNHYEMAPSVMRANGQSVYPAGVSDPSLANPPGPPPESAVPIPPTPALPAGPTPTVSPVWSPGGPASPNNPPPGIASASPWLIPPTMQTQVYPPATVVPQAEPLTQCSWYTRAEYFHWNERSNGTDFVNESGALFTLGYQRQIGIERFRAELFGGDVHYQGYDQYQATSSSPIELIPLTSNTGYLGLRGEYEMVLAPAVWNGQVAFLLGLGTRFWIRDLHDGSDDQGNAVYGYQETWWTTYPYLGLETHRRVGDNLDWYSESRIGTTAMTYQFAAMSDRPLWPKVGVFANTEMGLRGPRFFIAARAEVMTWAESSVVQGADQPNSVMFTAGGRLGFTF